MSRRPDRTDRPARQARARRLTLEPLEGRELLATFTVTTTADGGIGSLRAAIVGVDAASGGSTIDFSISGSGVQTIALQSPLPVITASVEINGTSEPGATSAGPPVIVLDGSAAGASASGLVIGTGAGRSTILGLAIVGFGGEGIYLAGTSGGNLIEDNYLGVEPDGLTAKANGNGLAVESAGNTIGGTNGTPSDLISGNTNAGIAFVGASATGNLVAGNLIGTDATGSKAVGNAFGVLVMASNDTIGGTAAGAGNVISANIGPNQSSTLGPDGAGILFEGSATGDLVEGNKIGTNAAGTAAVIPTGFSPPFTFSNVNGIYFGTPPTNLPTDNVTQETIGGTVAGAGNLISGNYIGIAGFVASSVIQGNTIGLTLAGTAAVPNGDGVFLNASLTTIGGITPAARNVISGSNSATGDVGTGLVLIGDSDVVQANFIGTAASGLAGIGLGNAVGMDLELTNSIIGGTVTGLGNVVAGNSGDGIDVSGGGGDAFFGNVIGLDELGNADANGGDGLAIAVSAPSPPSSTALPLNDSVGATNSGAGNVIAHSGGAGILVNDQAPNGVTGLSIRGNTILANAKLGIDLTGTGKPVPSTLFITGESVANGLVTITGNDFDAPGTTVMLDLFANSADPSGYGQGPVYLGPTAALTTNASGFATFSATFPSPSTPYTSFSATITPGSTGDTSEFAANFPTVGTVAQADLSLKATASSTSIIVGNSVILTETITNNGPAAANGVVFYDTLPTTFANPMIMASQGTVAVNPSIDVFAAQIGTLAAGASATVIISGQGSMAGALMDMPGVSSTTSDPNYANNVATQTIAVNPGSTGPTSDVAILVFASAGSTQVGGTLTYTISVGNLGPNSATSPVVVDTLPAGSTIVSIIPSQGNAPSINGNLFVDNLGTLAAGAVATITVVVKPAAAGSITDLATVLVTPEYDTNRANNSATVTTTVTAATPIIHFYLAQIPFPAAGAVGQFQAFTLYVENFGPSTATNVFLIDNLPANSTYYSATASQGGSPTLVNGQVIENFGTLAAGSVASLQLIVIPKAVGALINGAGVYTPDVPSAAPAFATATAPVVAGPSVVAINGAGNNAVIVLSFNEALVSSTATNPANYQLVAEGKSGTGPAKTIAIAAISYNPTTHLVAILPAQALDPTQYYKLTVIGATAAGVTDTLGRKLASTLYGAAGGNYSVLFFAKTLVQL